MRALEPVAPDLWRITTPLPFRPRSVHAYLARLPGGGYLLVDGGANTDAGWEALDGSVRDLAGGWGAVGTHVVTHMHLDHVGLVERVRAAGAGALAMGALDAERAAHARANPEEEAEYRAALLLRAGVPAELRAAIEQSRKGSDPLSAFMPADEALRGEEGALPGCPGWRWIWTPGHTAGHVSLWRASDRTLIGGDAVLPRVTPTLGVNRQRADPVGDYLESLERIRGLQPARILPGHGEVLEDPLPRVEDLRKSTLAESGAVEALVEPGGSAVWEVARARHPRPDYPPAILMHAVRETGAHLERLRQAGRLVMLDESAGVHRYAPAE